ncbi:MAG: hypothetical protein QXO86_05540 [Nitrososphaerota archaeon]
MKALVKMIKESRRVETAYELVGLVKDVCPPGVEWGFEIGRTPGILYIAEDGRIVALSISRDEFGPFMDTRMREVPVKNIPAEAISKIVSDPDGFLKSLVSHLSKWLRGAPATHHLRGDVEEFVAAFPPES